MTPTQLMLLSILADGLPHKASELRVCVDEMCSSNNLRTHIANIRKKMAPGETIICQYHLKHFCYRHVRLLASAYDGKR